mgnify:CR=1 FL=1
MNIVVLPAKEDPDSIARQKGPKLVSYLDGEEKDFIVFKSIIVAPKPP